MSNGHKLILTPFTGRKKWKVKYNKRKIHTGKKKTKETDRGAYYNKEDG